MIFSETPDLLISQQRKQERQLPRQMTFRAFTSQTARKTSISKNPACVRRGNVAYYFRLVRKKAR